MATVNRPMVDDGDYGFLWWWTASEIGVMLLVLGILVASLNGGPSPVVSIDRTIRLAGIAFIVLDLMIPVWVYLDSRRHPALAGSIWDHVAATPILNLFGLVTSFDARSRAEDRS